jgi:hypothetical protein
MQQFQMILKEESPRSPVKGNGDLVELHLGQIICQYGHSHPTFPSQKKLQELLKNILLEET